MSSTQTPPPHRPIATGKMLGALYGAMGLLFVPFFAVFGLVGAFMPKMSNTSSAPGAAFAGIGVVMMILIPVMYAVMGFIVGIIGAAIYNLIAKWVGGIEVEVE